MNFDSIGMDIPLNNKPKRGAKKKTRHCLQHQPNDCIETVANVISDSEDEIENPRPAKKSKIAEPSSSIPNCVSCNTQMKKKKGYYCPNGCTKNQK